MSVCGWEGWFLLAVVPSSPVHCSTWRQSGILLSLQDFSSWVLDFHWRGVKTESMFKGVFNIFMPLKMIVCGCVPPNRFLSWKTEEKKALFSEKPKIISKIFLWNKKCFDELKCHDAVCLAGNSEAPSALSSAGTIGTAGTACTYFHFQARATDQTKILFCSCPPDNQRSELLQFITSWSFVLFFSYFGLFSSIRFPEFCFSFFPHASL